MKIKNRMFISFIKSVIIHEIHKKKNIFFYIFYIIKYFLNLNIFKYK